MAEALLELGLLGPDHRMEAPVAREDAVGDEHVQVRWKFEPNEPKAWGETTAPGTPSGSTAAAQSA